MCMAALIRISRALYVPGISTLRVLHSIFLTIMNHAIWSSQMNLIWVKMKEALTYHSRPVDHRSPNDAGPSAGIVQTYSYMYWTSTRRSRSKQQALEEPSKMLISKNSIRCDAKHRYTECQYLPFLFSRTKLWVPIYWGENAYDMAQLWWDNQYWLKSVSFTHWGLEDILTNSYELLNLRALKISMLYKNCTFQCMGKVLCVGPGTFWNSTQNSSSIHCKIYILFTGENLRALRFKSS